VELAIPPIVTPLVVASEVQHSLSLDSHRIVTAIDRQARALLDGPDSSLRTRVLSALSPLEHAAMLSTYREADEIATARVDFLVDDRGTARALEINTTIPAMQGYSDAIAQAFLRAVGEQRGLDEQRIGAALAANGCNTDELLASLLSLHARHGGGAQKQRIAIVARPGDAQGGELDHYVRRWSAHGHHAFRATPSQIGHDGAHVLVDGAPVDLVYRHVFLRRLTAGEPLARLLHHPRAHHIWNPPSSHLELKAMLGLLSATCADDAESLRIGLTDDERGTLAVRLPWTRLCVPGPATAPDGSSLRDLLDFVRAGAASLVLKKSWDYGGRGVFLGAELASSASQEKLRTLLGARDRPYAWHELVEHIVRSGEAWVVQALVEVQPVTRTCLGEAGLVARALYADVSAFTSLGTDVPITGGAVRASTSRIVNIQGGGGLVPLLRDAAVRLLL
ncbi:MAG: hypothetical protein ABI321_01060, partial [Polyangia bacterium]